MPRAGQVLQALGHIPLHLPLPLDQRFARGRNLYRLYNLNFLDDLNLDLTDLSLLELDGSNQHSQMTESVPKLDFSLGVP